MEDIEEMIKRHSLEEDEEYVIVPFRDKDGRQKRRYLLRRKCIRITYTAGHFVDFPLGDVLRATVTYPDIPLSEALYRMYKDSD